MSASEAPVGRDTPFRLLILADLSGRGGRDEASESSAPGRPQRVDRDDFDALLAQLAPTIDLTAPDGERLTLQFRELDDFHPDRLVLRIEPLLHLRGLRDRLRNPALFEAAALETAVLLGESPPSGDDAPPPAPPAAEAITAEDLFGASLAATERGAPSPDADAERIVQDAIAPHMASVRRDRPTREQGEFVAAVEGLIGDVLREVLHHPRFQALEASWRGLYDVVRRTATDALLQIHVIDASRGDVLADLTSRKDLRETRLYRHLVEETIETAGGQPWAFVASDLAFDALPADVLLLSKLARVAEAAGATIAATARPGIVGCPSLGTAPHPSEWTDAGDALGRKAFDMLRTMPAARHIALVWPRFLARLPYGCETDATEDVPFEELPPSEPLAGRHDHLLWAGGAFLVAEALTARFAADGWDLTAERAFERGNLPAVVAIDADGERELAACAEALLTDRGVERIVGAGLVPLVSVRGQNVVRSGRLHSLAGRDTPLIGPWS